MYTQKPSGNPTPGAGKKRTLKIEEIKPREAIAMDLVVNLPITTEKHGHAFTEVDLKTNYGQIYPLTTKTAAEVAKVLDKTLRKPKIYIQIWGWNSLER